MLPADLDARALAALQVAQTAAELAKTQFLQLTRRGVEKKGLQDYVTAADKEIEELIQTALCARFPQDGFLGEESGGRAAEHIWVVDPIDGTSNFLRGIPLFGVSIAFVADGQTQVGVIAEPMRGLIYSAQRGRGAYANGQRLQVGAPIGFEEAIVGVGFNLRQDRQRFFKFLEALFARGGEFRRLGAASIALTQVAQGGLDAFWQGHLASWDVLAGLLLVEEAGGVSCDFLKNDGLTQGGPVLACVPTLAAALGELTGIKDFGAAARS